MIEKEIEMLSQYLDGELDELSTRRMAQRLAEEPELRTTFARMASVDQRIKRAFAGRDGVPDHVSAMLDDTAAPAMHQPRRHQAWPFALAASLAAVGALLVTLQSQGPAPNGTTLAEVLEMHPSMASGWRTLEDSRQVRPILSFRDVDGDWCREYLLNDQGKGTRGVACRKQGQWDTRIEVAAEIPGDSADYRPASATDADPIATYTSNRAEGIALSAAEEAELIAGNWQN